MNPTVAALARIESNQNPYQWGDGGRAMGRFQLHPDWLFGWAGHYHLSPKLGETWDSFAMRVVEWFVASHEEQEYGPLEIAMKFHVGHVVRSAADPDWDQEYADRFTREYALEREMATGA